MIQFVRASIILPRLLPRRLVIVVVDFLIGVSITAVVVIVVVVEGEGVLDSLLLEAPVWTPI
jgi:hypothetical protein